MILRSLPAFLVALALAGQPLVPEFEVASVKPSPPLSAAEAARSVALGDRIGVSGGPGSADPGRIDYSKSTLRTLLVRAYGLRSYQVFGPAWLDTEFYDIAAKVPPRTTREQLSLMLQRLLTERFRIMSHRENQQMRVYTLTVAKDGPKLKPAVPPGPPAGTQNADQAKVRADRDAPQRARLARLQADLDAGRSPSQSLSSVTVAGLAQQLSRNLDAPIIDKTGIEGNYSIELVWAPDDPRATLGEGSSGALAWPSLFAALQEQLGLKLDAGKGPVEVLVIDKAEKTPTEN